MSEIPPESAPIGEALPISPSLRPALRSVNMPPPTPLVEKRLLYISVLSIGLAVVAALIAKGLTYLIAVITNFLFFGKYSKVLAAPVGNHLGLWIIAIPVGGGLIVGLMARYGSAGIRGHGIPEAMEKVLTSESRIPARLTFLKPLSAAVAIGTGGPFGAEGPIIATGGALGSLIGQVLSVTAVERKTLLAAGAAAGMAATFAAPVSAVLLAIELLLFEFRPRSFIPVALAATTAAAVRFQLHMAYPVFNLANVDVSGPADLAIYIGIGLLVGVVSVGVTRLVYAVEDGFEKLPIHWMWWPAIGALPVGIIGYFYPATLGVGYENITNILSSNLSVAVVGTLCIWKCISWAVALGSGTSGGTLAPLFTIGGGLGFVLGVFSNRFVPHSHVPLGAAALVGMAAMFAGASRALLTSAVFAFETTLAPNGLLPLLGGCTAAYFASCLLMRNTIMTEKIARRGLHVPAEYEADPLSGIAIANVMTPKPVTIPGETTVAEIREKIDTGKSPWTHQGFPIVAEDGLLIGVLTRRDFTDASTPGSKKVRELLKRPPIISYADGTLRQAADHMINHDVGRVPVVDRNDPGKVIGIITRSDILAANRRRIDELKRTSGRLARPDNTIPVGHNGSHHL